MIRSIKPMANTKRTFLKQAGMMAVALSVPTLPGCVSIGVIRSKVPMRRKKIESAAILWYSQTGHTERVGKLIAKTIQRQGIDVAYTDVRDFAKNEIQNYDMIVIGSPVFYYDAPDFITDWIRDLPMLAGIPVASYVTFGGPEGNQHNAACSVLDALAEKEGVPIGICSFMDMASYPLSWSEQGASEYIWRSRHLPNKETYQNVRRYAEDLVKGANQGKSVEYARKLNFREIVTHMGPIWWTKKFVNHHSLIKDKCIRCGACASKCPADAIDLSTCTVDTESCVLCFGCINNCPAQAVYMESGGKRLIGYLDFMRIHNLSIPEPIEFHHEVRNQFLQNNAAIPRFRGHHT